LVVSSFDKCNVLRNLFSSISELDTLMDSNPESSGKLTLFVLKEIATTLNNIITAAMNIEFADIDEIEAIDFESIELELQEALKEIEEMDFTKMIEDMENFEMINQEELLKSIELGHPQLELNLSEELYKGASHFLHV